MIILSPTAPTQNSWGWQRIILCLGIIILIYLWKSKACYIIRNAKTYMSASSLKVVYCAFFHSAMELYFGETHRITPLFLEYKIRQLELWKNVGTEFCIEIYLRNYKFCLWHHNICYLY